MARMFAKKRGDLRALDEEAERENPIVYGRGATPSMGLSQFRGGGGIVGAGKPRGRPRKSSAKKMSEAMMMGEHLGKHLCGIHGGAFHRDFTEGLIRGSGFFDDVGHFFTKTLPNEFTNPESKLRGEVLPMASKIASLPGVSTALDVAGTAVGLPGIGTIASRGLQMAEGANKTAKSFGYGRGGSNISQTGRTEGGRRVKKVVGPSDGRRRRAEIVRKVMHEKGLKMIEASRYVKQHNLY